jgi:Protein of unknown function (DUF3800)
MGPAGVIMGETHIFLDESGFTGQDLLNPHQPVFCIASTTLDDTTADRYHAELLEQSNAREAKHNRLMRRTSGRARIANFLQQIKADDDAFAVWVGHKRFALLTYFVDLWCEPLALQSGFDLYQDGAALAMSNMTFYALPAFTSDEFMTSILQDFQTMMLTRSRQAYDRLLSNLTLKYSSSERDVQDILIPFLSSVHLLGYGHLRRLPEFAMDLAEAGLVRLCHLWRSLTPGPFILHHDRSTQLARDRHVWETVVSKDMPPAEFGAGDRHAIFPVNVQRAVFVDSVLEKQVQLCDVVAGAVATWGRGLVRKETSEYLELLKEVDLQPLVRATIWPEPKFDPDELGMRGWSGAMLDYLAEELAKRGHRQ